MKIQVNFAKARPMGAIKGSILMIIAASAAGFAPELYGGTVITNNVPANIAIINIDARADGSASY